MGNKLNILNPVFLACTLLGFTIFPGSYSGSVAADEQQAIRFGSVAMDIPAVMHKRLTPLTEYLSKELNRPVILNLSPNMPAAIEDVASGAVELAYLTPVAYLRAHEKGDAQLIAKMVTNKKSSFQLMIVVREDSSIKSVSDLEDKTFAFGDRAALLQRAVVVGANMPLEKFRKYDFLGHYDNIVRGVLHGDYDAGILKDTKAYKWQGRGIRILYSSPDLPPYNIAASKNVDEKLLIKLKGVFLGLDVSNPEQKMVIKALDKKYDGFAETSDKEYDVVRKLIEPFNK